MAGALRKTMVYLGLAEDQGRYDDEYDDGYDDHVEVDEPQEHRGAEVTHLPTRHPVAHVVQMLARVPAAWEIEVHLDAPVDQVAARLPPTLAELSAAGSGTRLEMHADSLDWAAGVLAGLRADFSIIRPDELKEHVAQLGSRLLLDAQRSSRRS